MRFCFAFLQVSMSAMGMLRQFPKTPHLTYASSVDLKTATAIAEKYLEEHLNSPKCGLVLFHSATMERDFGWVFFFGASDPSVLLLGNAPFIVDRKHGSIHTTGTAYPIEEYLESYARMGRTYPFAVPEYLVTLKKLESGLSKLELAKLIHAAGTSSVSDAKRRADEIADGKHVILTFDSAARAEHFREAAKRAGALVEIETRFN
jgi:hypothetical protein